MYPTQAELKAAFDYDPMTGNFTWLIGTRQRGQQAGSNRLSKRKIMIARKEYSADKIAFVWMGAECPAAVKHLDGDDLNDAYLNLKAVARSEGKKGGPKPKNYNEDEQLCPELSATLEELWISRSAA